MKPSKTLIGNLFNDTPRKILGVLTIILLPFPFPFSFIISLLWIGDIALDNFNPKYHSWRHKSKRQQLEVERVIN